MEDDRPAVAQRREEASRAGPTTDASATAPAHWEGLEETAEFKQLVAARWRFVLPATVFFLVYYFLLPLLNGLAPHLMRTNVIGAVNLAYLFALSQFFVAWILAWLYIRRANTVFDRLAEAVRRRASRGREGGAAA
jgi:uncharacterized membrane protein (DUF485 family)